MSSRDPGIGQTLAQQSRAVATRSYPDLLIIKPGSHASRVIKSTY